MGDDSPDEKTGVVVTSFADPRIRYFHHRPSFGQARNVDHLFNEARGERLVLLHDDDLLVDGALERLNAIWTDDPDADIAFGKQYLASEAGVIDREGSRSLNDAYHRSDDKAGLQASSAVSGLIAQIPNDGYMIRTELARRIGYRDEAEVGTACDYDFGLRLGISGARVYLVPHYTAIYRLSETSIDRQGSDAGYRSYCLAKSVDLPAEAEPHRRALLRSKAPMAIHGYLDEGDRKKAWEVVCSPHYSGRRLFSLGGLRILCRFLKI